MLERAQTCEAQVAACIEQQRAGASCPWTQQLVPCVKNAAFGVGPQSVYYVACDLSSDPLYVLDLESGRERRIGTLENLRKRPNGLSVSRDGRTMMYAKVTSQNDDLMLIENFR